MFSPCGARLQNGFVQLSSTLFLMITACYQLTSPVWSYLCPHMLNMKWKTSGDQYMDGLIYMTAHLREGCKICIMPINLLRNHCWCARNGFIMHIVCCLLNSVGDFNIGGVFGVVSFPRCVLRAPACRREGVLVFYSQIALFRHIKSICKNLATMCVRSLGMLTCWFGGATLYK